MMPQLLNVTNFLPGMVFKVMIILAGCLQVKERGEANHGMFQCIIER